MAYRYNPVSYFLFFAKNIGVHKIIVSVIIISSYGYT